MHPPITNRAANTSSYECATLCANVANAQTVQLVSVNSLRSYLSAKLPAINELSANKTVNAVEASCPYCVSVNPISMFIELSGSPITGVVDSEDVGKSTR